MPNIKGAIKRVRQTATVTERNTQFKTAMRTAIRKAEVALAEKDENAEALLQDAIKRIDKAASKGLIHKNVAARNKSRLMKLAA